MLTTILLALPLPLAPPAPPTLVGGPAVQDPAAEADYPTRLAEAGEDVEKLWALHEWCRANAKYSESREVLNKIVELDGDHEGARKALGHQFYDGRWFTSYFELSEYKREEDKRMLEKGLVRHGEGWVAQADLPFVRMGWVKGEDERWMPKAKLDRMAQEASWKEAGWQMQTDLVWVPPDEVSKWDEGLIKCGDRWLSMEEANQYHSQIGQWWTLPSAGGRFIAQSTLDWNTTGWANWHAERAYPALVKAYGVQPQEPPRFVVLRNLAQYNEFAQGNQAAQRAGTESQGHSSVHYSYFADAFIDTSTQPPSYAGQGTAYWDTTTDSGNFYGPLAVRHAAAQSYAEAIDPSWNAVSEGIASNGQQFPIAAFWAEKKIPRWMRYGTAVYAERFLWDDQPAEGYGGDWQREWSIDELRKMGGLRPVEQVFPLALDVNQRENSGKLLLEAGLIMHFVLDGNCAPVKSAHSAFKSALRKGEDTSEAVQALQAAIIENRDELSLFTHLD